MSWAGVDVGGKRKGFHAAVVDSHGVAAGPVALASEAEAVAWLRSTNPELVAVDSPVAPAPDGQASRDEERALCRAVCGIRYTPDRKRLDASPQYYEWIENGFALYAGLSAAGLASVECFPTASWTRWFGARGAASRARWTSAAVDQLAVGCPKRASQDVRDAVCAALTARAVAQGAVEFFGPIAVPFSPVR